MHHYDIHLIASGLTFDALRTQIAKILAPWN